MKEKPLIVTFSHLIEDHVNQDVSPTPASSVAAESERGGGGGGGGEGEGVEEEEGRGGREIIKVAE